MPPLLLHILYALAAIAVAAIGLATGLHALLRKREPYSAVFWMIICFTIPLIGPLFYIVLGINRINRHAGKLLERSSKTSGLTSLSSLSGEEPPRPARRLNFTEKRGALYPILPNQDEQGAYTSQAAKPDAPEDDLEASYDGEPKSESDIMCRTQARGASDESVNRLADLRVSQAGDQPEPHMLGARHQHLKHKELRLRMSDKAFNYENLPEQVRILAGIGKKVTGLPLLCGNQVIPLYNGEGAYPPMLEAIENAASYIWIESYIFDNDEVGKKFIDALGRAVKRGVDVRVLVDGIGTFTTRPRTDKALNNVGAHTARFLPPRLIPPQFSINLRNHRKLMLVDGTYAFTGGMNISYSHMVGKPKRSGLRGKLDTIFANTLQDVHFKVRGPVLEQLQMVFVRDWLFCTNEELDMPPVDKNHYGDCFCRSVLDGPDDFFERFHAILLGAISAARKNVSIITPYFLPPRELTTALQSAALRGVDVAVILPIQTDQPLVKWATGNMLWEFIGRGVHIYYQPPPFAHTKMLLIDDNYAHIGSANLDPRSLRLNFELTMEVFDRDVTAQLGLHFRHLRGISREYTRDDLQKRSLPVQIRDALVWTLSPYL